MPLRRRPATAVVPERALLARGVPGRFFGGRALRVLGGERLPLAPMVPGPYGTGSRLARQPNRPVRLRHGTPRPSPGRQLRSRRDGVATVEHGQLVAYVVTPQARSTRARRESHRRGRRGNPGTRPRPRQAVQGQPGGGRCVRPAGPLRLCAVVGHAAPGLPGRRHPRSTPRWWLPHHVGVALLHPWVARMGVGARRAVGRETVVVGPRPGSEPRCVPRGSGRRIRVGQHGVINTRGRRRCRPAEGTPGRSTAWSSQSRLSGRSRHAGRGRPGPHRPTG